jgi:hypothetical protein
LLALFVSLFCFLILLVNRKKILIYLKTFVALIPEIMLREHFLPPFEAAVKAGAISVMVNSAEVNGVPGHANSNLTNQ